MGIYPILKVCALNIGETVGNFQFDYAIIYHNNVNPFYTPISTALFSTL